MALNKEKFQQIGTGAVNRTVEQKLNEFISVEDFGAVGDGITDDTLAIQAAVTAAELVGGVVCFPAKNYLISRQGGILGYDGATQNYYAVLITSPVTLDLGEATFTINQSDATYCTGFLASGTTRVTIEGGYFQRTGAAPATKFLFTGASAALQNCSSSVIRGIRSYQMRSGAQMYNCTGCRIENCESELDTTYYAKSGTHFGCYSGSENVIEGCVSHVSCGDGDIFLYGSGNRNKIINCQAYNYSKGDATKTLIFNIGQGMGADSGQRHATLQGNTVYGMYYGIDVKNDSNFTKVIGNTAISCKAGICSRLGEAPGRSYNIVIADNVVNCMKGMTQFTYGTEVHFGDGTIKTCGIYLEESIGHTVTGNSISIMGDTSSVAGFRSDFVGVHYTYNGAVDDSVQKGTLIANNLISHQTSIGANNYYSLGPNIWIKSNGTITTPLRGLVVSGNKFDSYFGAGVLYPGVSINNVNEVTISNNSFSQMRDFPLISLNTCNRVTITGNACQNFRQFLSATSCLNINVNGNTLGANVSTAYGGTLATLLFTSCTYMVVADNVIGDTTNGDGKFIQTVTSDWLNMTGNMVASLNWSSATYTSFDGSLVNSVVANNLVN